METLILAINPGSTSTKLALYENENELWRDSILHTPEDLSPFHEVADQTDYRLALIEGVLRKHGTPMDRLSAVVGRGGILPPVKSGGYIVSDKMIDTLKSGGITPHASNLGAILARRIADPLHIPAYIYDAVSSGNLLPEAKITGMPQIPRQSFCHVLNSHAAAIKAAEEQDRRYQDMCFIVAHLGGGISFSAHRYGEIIDSIGDDDGAFSPERSGSVPLLSVVRLCFSGKYSEHDMLKMVRGRGGMYAHLGTSDCQEIERRIDGGDEYAALVFQAQALQIAKGIGVLSAAMRGQVDEIILTGGLAYSKRLTQMVRDYVRFIAPVRVIPGENELKSLALGTLRILRVEEKAHEF